MVFTQSSILSLKDKQATIFVWNLKVLSEHLILSMSGCRPERGYFSIEVRLDSSPWLPYLQWGVEVQKSFSNSYEDIRIYQDEIFASKAREVEVRLTAHEGALLEGVNVLHASFKPHAFMATNFPSQKVSLAMSGLSQLALQHPRHLSLCSPTSVTAVLHFLGCSADALKVAERVNDQGFDIYGNWPLNCMQASALLGSSWMVYPAFLASMDPIFEQLQQGWPSIVSIRGKLPHTNFSYEQGHLVVIRGYDPASHEVLCMDPAYPSDAETLVRYPADLFLQAWQARGGLAYLFETPRH